MLSSARICALFLLLCTAAPACLRASSTVGEESPAARLAGTLRLQQVLRLSVRNMVPPGVAQELAWQLAAADEELWQLMESEVAAFLAETFDDEQLAELVTFFEGPIGQAVVQGEAQAYSVFLDTASFEEIQETVLRAMRGETEIDQVVGPAQQEYLEETLDAEQLAELDTFVESDLGKAWDQATAAMMHRLMAGMSSEGSFMRKLASLGCVVGAVAPNIEDAKRKAGMESAGLPASAVENLRPVIEGFQAFCDCFMARVAAKWSLAELSQLQGTPEFQQWVGQMFEAGECPMPVTEEVQDTARLKRTILEVRNVGTAMMSWLTDQITADEYTLDAPAAGEPKGWTVKMEGEEAAGYFSAVSPEFLAGLLVPDYMPELPLVDGWGNPYEFAINVDFLGDQVLGIRSAGKDGVFDGDEYSSGGPLEGGNVGPEEILAGDIVWTDGYLLSLTKSAEE